jgi:LuxR family maltose regulon positive regulatory protein
MRDGPRPRQNHVVPNALLETKLYAPHPRPGVVPRPRLAGLLERGARSKLTVVSAPPGFGKSTLVAEWLASSAGRTGSTAWVSLDPGDDDVRSFWTYVTAAIERASTIGDVASPLLDSNAVPVETVLTTLLNALAERPDPVLLVIDDYHVIEQADVHEGFAFLLDHAPPRLHVVLITRSDPPLPLARFRARGDLVEIRAADLRFTEHEAEAYLNGSMDLGLTTGDVAVLGGRTEGWIAALQLAALSIGGRPDPGAFIKEFAGDDRYIVDYLVEEVLDRQAERIQRFLLETSILDRMTGPLCDAVTEADDGGNTLEALERANLFVIALDDRRRWYRYHHLFADVLRARSQAEQPDLIPTLHRRASAWFEQEGDHAAAIDHALAADDISRAADLIELAAPGLFARRQDLTLRRWLDALPGSIFETRPALAIIDAGTRLSVGRVDEVDERLTAAERWIPAVVDPDERTKAEAAGMIIREPAFLAHLPSAVPLHRAGLARMRGDVAATIVHAEAALAAAGPDQLGRGGAAGLLALAYWTAGDLDGAYAAWTRSFESLKAAGRTADLLGLSIAMADIRITQGRLGDAETILERGLGIGTRSEASPLRGTADMRVGLTEIDRERNDLAAARKHLEAAESLGEAMGLPQNPYRLRVARARIALAEGQPDEALSALDEAEQRYDGDFSPNVRPIAALRARVWVQQGRLVDARAWSRDVAISADDGLTYLREYEHGTLARLLLAEGVRDRDDETIDAAIRLADRLLRSALDGGRQGSALDVLVVLALARHARGEIAGAAADLDHAVALAEPDRWVRVFLDEGAPMLALLSAVTGRAGSSAFVSELRAAAGSTSGRDASRQALIEPLSQRELEVLRLLRSDLDGPDLARELHISLNTLRTHTKNIYTKLDVNTRRSAILRADELDLF